MSFQLSRRDVDSAYAYANRSMRRLRRDPEEQGSSGVLHQMLKSGEVVAGAVAVGVASGRFGPLNIANTPVPLDLTGGIAGHLLAFWLDNAASPHIHNLSTGVLAGYGTKLGVGVGTSLRLKAGLPPMMTSGDAFEADQQLTNAPQYDIVGAMNAGPPKPLTEAELAALAQQVR